MFPCSFIILIKEHGYIRVLPIGSDIKIRNFKEV